MSLDYPLSDEDFLAYDADEAASYPLQDEYVEPTDEELGEELSEELGDTDSETDDDDEEEEPGYSDLQTLFEKSYITALASDFSNLRRLGQRVVDAQLAAMVKDNDVEGLTQVADVLADIRNVVGPRLGPDAFATLEKDLQYVRKERRLAGKRKRGAERRAERAEREARKARRTLELQWAAAEAQELEELEAAQAAAGME